MRKNTCLTITSLTLLISLTLTACGSTNGSTGTADEQAEVVYYDDYTLDDIAAMNEGEDIISLADGEDGYLLFLGNKYCEETISDENEALDSLQHLHTLLGLDNVNLDFFKMDVSPVTGNKYYTFYQTSQGEINGETMNARFYNSLVKVITDADGYSLGVSAELTHDANLEYTSDEFVAQDYAESGVQNAVGSDKRVYTEVTELVYWSDEGTAHQVTAGKVVPAYLIYADADTNAEDNTLHKPYQVYVVAAEYPDADYDLQCLSIYYTDSLDPEAFYNVYTSNLYFEGLEDAGEYTYTVSLDWVKEAYPEYDGEMSREVTVPVMRETETGLYYLGSKAELIACTNSYDFEENSTLNSYVTDDPDNLDSWHFYDMTCDEKGIDYFNDPNYVLASFETFVDVAEEFEDRYGLTSVDSTDLPLLLEVYGFDDDEYPDDVSGFMQNAYNLGQKRDWAVMCVSPTLADCLNHSVMGHEYTHGINSQLTSTQYYNAPGAIMESYADIIGTQMALLNGHHDDAGDWQHGGKYAEQIRSLSDPNELGQPKYLGGIYYIYPIGSSLGEVLDYGGVHTNSGVCNYLAYCLVNGSDQLDNDNTLSMDDNLDMWFETLYMTNYLSDYYDVAQYLRFAAKSMDLPKAQQDYLYELLKKYGMAYDENGEFSTDVLEECREITFHVEASDDSYAGSYELGFDLYDPDGEFIATAGAVTPGNDLTFRVKPGEECSPALYIGDLEAGVELAELNLTNDVRDTYNIDFEVVSATVGDTYVIPGDEDTIYNSNWEDIFDYLYLDEDGNVAFDCDEEGTIAISCYLEDEDVYKVICFNVGAVKRRFA